MGMRNSSQITHLHVKSPDSLRKQTYQVRAGGFPGGSDSKESACNAGDLGLILGSGRSPGEGCSCPLQYPCLGKPMGREGWRSQSKRSWRVRHDRVTNTHTHTHTWMGGGPPTTPVTLAVKSLPASAGDIKRCGLHPCVGKIPWRGAW